jgi:O-antigen ligase
MLVLLAAAMPVRLSGSVLFLNSVSILDILLIVAALTLFMDLAFRPPDLGYRGLFLLLCVPLVMSVLSLVWSEDRTASLRAVLISVEAVVAYLFVVREMEGLDPARVVTYIRRYAYLLIIPAVLLLLHVPGFAPQVDYKETSGDYLTFYYRLSHPFIGASNNLATVLAFLAPILLYWGHIRHDRRATFAGFITAVAILLTLSRGVLLAFVIAGVLYAFLGSAGRRVPRAGLGSKIAATVALGAIAVVVFYNVNPPTREFFTGRLSLTNAEARADLLSSSFESIASRPVLGFGSGVGPSPDPLGVEESQAPDIHNTYLQQALYFGLPLGLIFSLALWGTVAVFLSRRRSAPLAGVIAYTLLVQLVSFLFESSFEGTVLRVLFYLCLGLAVALLRADESGRSSPGASASDARSGGMRPINAWT